MVYADEKGEKQTYLSQIAYDRYYLAEGRLDIEKFYGWFLKADWNDNLLDASCYEKGELKFVLQESNSRARQ